MSRGYRERFQRIQAAYAPRNGKGGAGLGAPGWARRAGGAGLGAPGWGRRAGGPAGAPGWGRPAGAPGGGARQGRPAGAPGWGAGLGVARLTPLPSRRAARPRVGTMRIGFGAPVSGAWASPRDLASFGAQAEEAGYASLWTFQRLLIPADAKMDPVYRCVLDPMVALGFLAAGTSRIRLGVALINMPFISPACWPSRRPRSMCCPAAGSTWVSGSAGCRRNSG